MTSTNDEGQLKKPPKLNKKKYEKELRRLQAELVAMQQWVIETGERVCLIFEGRDAAGKGSAIARITQYLNPRHAKVVALPAPTEREKTQWYFQRYTPHLPAAGEIVIFDRSWYNRAGVERVMGFCSIEEYHRFLRQAPDFERMLVDDGIRLIKYWFSVSAQEQEARFRSRSEDPMRRWKLSPMDVESISRWDDYSRAKDAMFAATDTPWARWHTVESEDKKRSRINVINDILHQIPWKQVEPAEVSIPHRPEGTDDDSLDRLDRNKYVYVEDVAVALEKD
ncbi:MAG: polyphosphate kinase 2 [Flaviflexus sp.]|uniref:polyphosphate kinase 2 n=1 Tax=Flaviflexus sp. TaxID=1969482 RepID=UPI00352BFC06